MNWRIITIVLLSGLLLGIGSALVLRDSVEEQITDEPAVVQTVEDDLPAPQVDTPPPDPSLDGEPAMPPDALPALSADYPPVTAPVGELPPLPMPGDIAILPAVVDSDPSGPTPSAAGPPPPPVQDLSPPKGHAKIEQAIRGIGGVSSLAWGEHKTLHILVRNASPASIATAACSKANAITKGVRVHVQSVSDPDAKQSERTC